SLFGDIRKGLQKTSGVLDFESTSGASLPMRVSGYSIPEMNDHCFLALSIMERADMTEAQRAAMSVEGFTAQAVEALRTAGVKGKDVDLTLIQLGDLNGLKGRSSVDEVRAFTNDILAQLSAKSLGGTTATAIGEDKFGILHKSDENLAEVEEAIAAKSRAIDPDGKGIEVSAGSLKLGAHQLDEADAVRALVYTMSQFSLSEDAVGVTSLRKAYENMLHDTAGRMGSFRRLVREGNFRVAFQPVVSLSDGKVHHYEALVRFADAEAESSPFTLISFAEDVGLIAEFDRAMCLRVAEMAQDAGPEVPLIAVNLSARSIIDPTQFKALYEMLGAYSGLEKRIMLEVTESFGINDLKAARAALGILRKAGYTLCLDNFGAGAANLDYLRNFPVHYVKFDDSYIRSLLTTPKSQSFLRAMVSLCQTLELKTAAEHVSNEETARLLQQIGVDLGQGYFYGKPDFSVPGLAEG
ncbi:MAG: EAL domain-containing protein, partial [Alphaproteobacteria bacterium]|nr:EAL domain-containing protein [Alphaproteobacteria bacterium]